MIEALLKKLKQNITMVANGEEAWQYYQQQPKTVDLILMDCEMPVMDGYLATETIRAFEREQAIRAVPIFALTAHALDENRQRCLRIGMDGVITKPVKVNTLKSLLFKLNQ
ncbi:response regulator [Oceanicoccus sp. KOV_DT_Chl]|uniref:response regulator n=1 Tax=Oceanicoccus sp. KOV_DT_Chl TaxID=1904639 RepID=UPI00135A0DC1|nr:response regulator [Oceanicoccus sp. KOV_DT_Chl]